MPFLKSRSATPVLAVALLAGSLVTVPARAQNPDDRHIYPLSKSLRTPKFVIDVSEAPEARPWAERAQKLVEEWYPHLTQLLATEKYRAPKTIKLIFKKGINAPAYASGDAITVNADWIRKNPDDFGMMIHELTHVIQSYPRSKNKPGWLVEGIADYIRWWRYEPEVPRTPINKERASYRDSYRTTAWFLAWATAKYNRMLVPELDRALRAGTYSDELFVKLTGKPLDDLWTEFVTTLK